MDIFELSWPVLQSFGLCWIDSDTPSSHYPSQDINRSLFKLALARFEEVGTLFHPIQEGMDDLFMSFSPFFVFCCGDPPIVHVITQLIQIFLKEDGEISMHNSLEEGRCVAETEVHDIGHICSKRHFESRLVSILLGNANIIVPPSNIKLGEQPFSMKPFQSCLYVWERVVVSDSMLVNLPIIHYDALFITVLFVDEIDWGGYA
jgi:hypothetical protein